MRHFVRQSMGGRRCAALNQDYTSFFSDEVFNIISQDINNIGIICESLDEYFEYTNKHRKKIEEEYDSYFEDYKDINEEERTKYINYKLNKLSIHEKIQKLNLNDDVMNFDAISLYPSAMWEKNQFVLK